ncbi:MAG TPA: triose-phosphate isomerase [Candidatus Limnocylindrales bacterium]|nr:triose-phosphate isomerase [Candidatus Limnocylindrales bacterium]
MSHSTRRRVIAGNWKMFKTPVETRAFFAAFNPMVADVKDCEIVIAPPAIDIPAAVEATRGTQIGIASQNIYWEREGAFTGEISAGMVMEAGCRYAIIGHSERRHVFGETSEMVLKKTKAALAAGLMPIVCIGELLADRQAGATESVCKSQFQGSVGALTPEEFSRILVAYEPVWAIGTGHTATPEIAAAVHKYVRQCAAQMFSADLAAALRILYGGSVKPDNIQGLMAQVDIDGVLVGGASLDAKSFASIVKGWDR